MLDNVFFSDSNLKLPETQTTAEKGNQSNL